MARSARPGRPESRTPGRPRGRLGIVAALLAALPFQVPAAFAATGDATVPPLVADPASLVNPLIGTSGAVDTFPGPDMPFGMMQWGPDTTPDRALGGGYEYKDHRISGFSLTHLSGPGCAAAGDVPMLPVAGALPADPGASSVGFRHADERTGIGSYRVTDSSGVTTALTTATRAGLGRFTFPRSAASRLLLKLSGGATRVDGTQARVVGDREVVGAVRSGHFCGADNTYTLHFDIVFDHPFSGSGTWVGRTVHPNATRITQGRPRQELRSGSPNPHREPHFTVPGVPPPAVHTPSGTPRPEAATPAVTGPNGMYLTFDTATAPTVTASVGISYTSDAAARLNRVREAHGFAFDAMRRANHDAWNALLRRVSVGGGSHDQQVEFYTALYHALLHPNVFSDEDGHYAGMDDRVHALTPGQRAQYANYSGWDTYRSQTQLLALVAPRVAGDVVTSMLNGYDQSGRLPKWAQNNGESYVMVGDPADAVIAGAHAFGARFDTGHALRAMIHQATTPNNDRPGEAVRDAAGYLPADHTGWPCCNFYGTVSTQLEYDTADYAIAALAGSAGDRADRTRFATRAQDWQNVFDPRTGYARARLADGAFAPGFTPGTSYGFVEGSSAQYTPMVPFNLRALIAARGGPAAYAASLDGLLSDLAHPGPLNANLSNEPSLEIPWEYDYLGRPWKTQAAVRRAQRELYFNAPVGSFGNDDLGAMSSWYVWSELGMYPMTPGTGTLVLGSPVFPRARLVTGGGRVVRIDAPRAAPDAPYVHALRVRGRDWDRPWMTFGDLAAGGTLAYDLGTAPDPGWAAAASQVPPSDGTGERGLLVSAGAPGAAPGPSGALVLPPGGSGPGEVAVANVGRGPATVRWSARPPAGVTVRPAAGTLTVPAGGRALVRVSVTAGEVERAFAVPFVLRSAGGRPVTGTLPVAVARPGALWPYATVTAVQPDGATFSGGFDGNGWAYSRQALAAAGVPGGDRWTVDGIAYRWPRWDDGRPDALRMDGQTIPEDGRTATRYLGLLGAAGNAPAAGSGGELTVTYTDGSTTRAPVELSDWTLRGGAARPLPGEAVAVSTPYRDKADGGRQQVAAYVFAVRVPLAPGRRIASITLPDAGGSAALVFALGFGG